MIVNGRNKHVTEVMEETQENHTDDTGDREICCQSKTETNINADDFSSPTVTSPYHQREWIDVEPGQ